MHGKVTATPPNVIERGSTGFHVVHIMGTVYLTDDELEEYRQSGEVKVTAVPAEILNRGISGESPFSL
jgi:hypothetical protein